MDKTYTVGISTVLWKVFQPANALMDVMQGIDKLLVDENDVDYLTFQGLADLSKLAQEAVNRRNDEVEIVLAGHTAKFIHRICQ